jgi:DNA polymerase-3 subunit beta
VYNLESHSAEHARKGTGFHREEINPPHLEPCLPGGTSGTLFIKGTDLHTSIQVTSECNVEVPGACAINAKSFYDVIRELPDSDILLFTDDNNRAHISVETRR